MASSRNIENIFDTYAPDAEDDGWVTKSELVYLLHHNCGLTLVETAGYVNDFFTMADRFNEGRIRLADFVVEYKRMSNFKMVKHKT